MNAELAEDDSEGDDDESDEDESEPEQEVEDVVRDDDEDWLKLDELSDGEEAPEPAKVAETPVEAPEEDDEGSFDRFRASLWPR